MADAKNRFSELISRALLEGPQRVQRRREAVVVVSEKEYERLTGKRALQKWMLQLETDYGDRILPIDAETARIWGEVTARAQRDGVRVAAVDGLIAATAIRHGLRLMTRNVADFEATGAMILNPWTAG